MFGLNESDYQLVNRYSIATKLAQASENQVTQKSRKPNFRHKKTSSDFSVTG